MIDRIVVENFKSLRRVDLELGRMNLLIGANASGKSNFLDALRVLQGIGHGFTIDEVLNGRPEGATRETWKGIRGGSGHACFSGADGADEVAIKVRGTWGGAPARTSPEWQYDVVFSPGAQGRVVDERIDAGELQYRHGDFPASFRSDPSRPALGMLDEVDRRKIAPGDLSAADAAYWLAEMTRMFSNAQRVDPAPEVLRGYSPGARAKRMGDRGENFAAVVGAICEDEQAKDAYLACLRHLRSEGDVEDVGTRPGAVGEPMFVLRENGREFPAPVLSGGTLRFAAVTAAFFQHDVPGLMTIEEVERGVHAGRVQILLELLRGQAEAAGTQVVATTHSAAVLDWLQEEDYRTTFLFGRDEATGESKVRSLADVPRFLDAARKKPVSEVLSEGWLDAAS